MTDTVPNTPAPPSAETDLADRFAQIGHVSFNLTGNEAEDRRNRKGHIALLRSREDDKLAWLDLHARDTSRVTLMEHTEFPTWIGVLLIEFLSPADGKAFHDRFYGGDR